MSCTVEFSGNIAPVAMWKQLKSGGLFRIQADAESNVVTIVDRYNTIQVLTSTLMIIETSVSNGDTYICEISAPTVLNYSSTKSFLKQRNYGSKSTAFKIYYCRSTTFTAKGSVKRALNLFTIHFYLFIHE